MAEKPQLPAAVIQAIYERLPAVVRIDIQNYLFAWDWLQSETNGDTRAHLISELERIERKYGITVERKKSRPDRSGQ
ncbi:hypothetical protein FRY98_24625 [Paenibacillus faecis]|uniref:Uncharacterized protein n=1 Tax=Paenibacillus faecis TaxID=862114 RepID=A0A5D0CLX7_9BACL|nr:hypothetical protein [Paenibacillus faecis]TYA10956.1 hypothetical protein FRY98_24625 [Paenibacillus faecis]